MNKTIITTVGTSLITNCKGINSNSFDILKNKPFFGNYSNKDDFELVEEHLKKIRPNILTSVNKQDACAEISSILAIEKELKITDKNLLTIHLLCTDTILSPLCAEVIAKYLAGKGYNVSFEQVAGNETIISKMKEQEFSSKYIIKNLNLKGYSEQGLLNLIEQIKDITNKAGTEDTLLNITGGYKALIPPITILAQLYRLSIYYLYEDSSDIIHLPPMPVGFDWEVIEK